MRRMRCSQGWLKMPTSSGISPARWAGGRSRNRSGRRRGKRLDFLKPIANEFGTSATCGRHSSVEEGLIAVTEIGAHPDRRMGDRAAGPLAVGEGDRGKAECGFRILQHDGLVLLFVGNGSGCSDTDMGARLPRGLVAWQQPGRSRRDSRTDRVVDMVKLRSKRVRRRNSPVKGDGVRQQEGEKRCAR